MERSKKGVSLSGYIHLNGCDISMEDISYVTDTDALFPYLSVWDSIYYHTIFQMSPDTSRAVAIDKATSALNEVGLVELMHRKVGSTLDIGERRRLVLAQQLTSKSAVLLFDDPTLGLDGYQSQRLMEILRNLAGRGRIVSTLQIIPCSIHKMIYEHTIGCVHSKPTKVRTIQNTVVTKFL